MTCEGTARSAVPLQLAPGQFFSSARLGRSGGGIEVSHRIAAGLPDQVVTLSLDSICLELLGSMDPGVQRLPTAPPRWLALAGCAVRPLHRFQIDKTEAAL